MNADELTVQWANRVGCLKASHYQASARYERWHIFVGCVLIFFSALAAALAPLREPFAAIVPVPYWATLQAAVGLIATVLAGLQTFVRWSERAEKHRSAGATYAKLELHLEQLLTFPRDDTREVIGNFYDEWARLTGGSPTIPPHIYHRNCACLDRDPCGRSKPGTAAAATPAFPAAASPPRPPQKLLEYPVFFSRDRNAVLRLPGDLSVAEADRLVALLRAVALP